MINIHSDSHSTRIWVSVTVGEHQHVHEILQPISHNWVSVGVHVYSLPRDVASHALALIVQVL